MSKDAGYLVETKTGLIGRTFHRDGLINKKTVVYVEKPDGSISKILCTTKTLKIIGFVDGGLQSDIEQEETQL